MTNSTHVRDVFADIQRALPVLSLKEYPATEGKLGLRLGSAVVFTYNSYRKGCLDTSVALGPKLHWFAFKPTHNKPSLYWAAKLDAFDVRRIYFANRNSILSVISSELPSQQAGR